MDIVFYAVVFCCIFYIIITSLTKTVDAIDPHIEEEQIEVSDEKPENKYPPLADPEE